MEQKNGLAQNAVATGHSKMTPTEQANATKFVLEVTKSLAEVSGVPFPDLLSAIAELVKKHEVA